MFDFTQRDVEEAGERILSMNPEPVPRFRTLRDVLHIDRGSAEYATAKNALNTSIWVQRLESSQQDDGTWGRFHTQDTKVKQPFPTTQVALRVALECGLDAEHPIIQRLLPTLTDYVNGEYIWPDWPEKHDNPDAWPIWVRHFSAAALAEIDPLHPALDEFWHIRAESLKAAFGSGVFDRDAEIAILVKLLECRMKNPVPFHTHPSLMVITATGRNLPEKIERSVIEHLLTADQGIYYTCNHPIRDYPTIDDRRFCAWLNALFILARFRLWREYAAGPLNALWSMRNDDGLWDVGNKVGRKPYSSFPLSDSWRRRENRIIDSTVLILTLLATAFAT